MIPIAKALLYQLYFIVTRSYTRIVQGRCRTSLVLRGSPKLNLAIVLILALTLTLAQALALALALAMNVQLYTFRHLLMNYGHPVAFLD